ncbi:MAG TPA: hypothetical protein VKU82_05275 [Planctomycetaceae bacterium]|nr:hypothetical protein [Planctomycetaceae bacterium]
MQTSNEGARRLTRLWPGRALWPAFLAMAVALIPAGASLACPICGQPTVTLTERLARADAALLVEWVSAQAAPAPSPGETIYEIVEVQRDSKGIWKRGERLAVSRFTQGKSGNLYLLLGKKDDRGAIKWDEMPLAVSETIYQYVLQAPTPETAADKRLSYFLKFLEFPDLTIANDAFAEFANAPTKDIFALAGKLPKDKIRRWLADPKTPITRQSGYGLMLGLCGGPDDAQFLKQRIASSDPERQIRIEGVIVGYLLLAGEKGLATIEKTRFADKNAEEGDSLAAVQALRYYWTYGDGKIPPGRLMAALRLLIDRPSLAETAIIDLARWKDWSLHERLMQLYGTSGYNAESTRKAIIRYMIASTKDVPAGAEQPPHVLAGRKCLDELRRRDPKLVANTEKYFFLN